MKRPISRLMALLPRLKGRHGGAAVARRRRLRRLLHRTPVRDRGFAVSPLRLALGVGVVVALSFLLAVRVFPSRASWHVGETADREIVAQRTVRYEDTEATDRQREDAAQQAEKKYEQIPAAASAASEAVRGVFDRIDEAAVQARPSPPQHHAVKPLLRSAAGPTARSIRADGIAADLKSQSNLVVDPENIAVLLAQGAGVRQQARDIAIKLVEREMDHAITAGTSDLDDARDVIARSDAVNDLPISGVREAIAEIAVASLRPTRRYDQRATERTRDAARASVVPQMRRLPAGATVIRPGDKVTRVDIDKLTALGLRSDRLDASAVMVIVALVAFLVGLVAAYLRRFHRDLYENTAELLLLAVLCVFSVLGLKIGSALLGLSVPGVHFGYLGMMCVASAGMVIALLISPRVATLVVSLLAVASGLVMNNELRFTVITLGSSLVGIVAVTALRNRNDLLRATLLLCGANALLNVLAGQWEGDLPQEILLSMVWGVVSGVFALGLFYIGVALLERPFGITTHLRLLEITDPATPILQEFRLRVPGTYAHSLMVSNLAQAAAEAIGADPLLVRVAAYYHDIGKMNRPEFFIENQSNAENIHDRISPSLSAIILASHVKEGVELAQEIGLPPRVRELIQQHHGTSLMKYFYHRATNGLPDPRLEAQFRYAGPKPQTKEAAILMLADTVEAASRTLDRPTLSRVAEFVARMIEEKRADGQLDECDLTLRDLATIEDVLTRTLSGALHARVEYPSERTEPKVTPMPSLSLEPIPPPTPFEDLSVMAMTGGACLPSDLASELITPHGDNDPDDARPAPPALAPGRSGSQKTPRRRR
jgi:putative nucleotidyltransferase with HDIG domain